MKKLRWGVIGAGGIAQRRTIPGMMQCENAELVAVMEITPELAESCRAKWNCKKAYTSAEELLNDPEISIILEFLGGEQPAFQWDLAALERGKTLVTANKVAFALHWHELQQAARKSGAGLYYEAAVCGAIPIIHTMEESLQAKQKHLLESVHSRKIKVNYHDSTTSFLEGVFAKGDRRLAPVIVEAYKRGCYFDGWEECFKYDTWMQTFADLGIDPAFYCQRPIALDEVTPWSHMDYGITHEYLVREYNKALAAQTTQPCNRACHGCGANHLLGGPCFDYSQNLV